MKKTELFNREQYSLEWCKGNDIVVTSYEALREDCYNELTRVIFELTGEPLVKENVITTVDKFSFERQTGRKSGQEDFSDNKRKGVVGGWREYFNRESSEVFNNYCGTVLIQLGYEENSDWVKQQNW